jgi:hypothetical protein
MGFTSGSRDIGEDVTEICAVPENGVRIRNTGNATVYVGGPDVMADGDAQGYPIGPDSSEDFAGVKAKESPVVPAPEGDMDPARLYARTAPGSTSRVSFISVSMS